MRRINAFHWTALSLVLATAVVTSGCVAAAIGAGAAGGYVAAKDMEDGKLIDSQ